MQDRYLFRGRIWKGQDWVKGYIFEPDAPDCDDNFGAWIVDENYFGIETFLEGELATCKVKATLVQRPTIGRCTGLKDKNGTLIFEGDIVEFLTGEGNYDRWLATNGRPYIKFDNYVSDGECTCGGCNVECGDCENFELEGYGLHLHFNKTKDTPSFTSSDAKRCLVVGNIHDNPELLQSNA